MVTTHNRILSALLLMVALPILSTFAIATFVGLPRSDMGWTLLLTLVLTAFQTFSHFRMAQRVADALERYRLTAGFAQECVRQREIEPKLWRSLRAVQIHWLAFIAGPAFALALNGYAACQLWLGPLGGAVLTSTALLLLYQSWWQRTQRTCERP